VIISIDLILYLKKIEGIMKNRTIKIRLKYPLICLKYSLMCLKSLGTTYFQLRFYKVGEK
jgi:hypothetical protein